MVYMKDCQLKIGKGTNKQTTDLQKELEQTFLNDSYCYFPPNRFERPHWMNKIYDGRKNKLTNKQYNYNNLDKPFIIESAVDDTNSWILDVFLDASVTIQHVKDNDYIIENTVDDRANRSKLTQSKKNIEQVLSKILKRDVELALTYRNNSRSRIKVIDSTKQEIIPSLNNLSTGQSVLFNLFCTVMRYGEVGDISHRTDQMSGIVIIDEIDLHLHSDLQKEVLPKLIKLFPKIQFIITTHSPLFVLGMEAEFNNDGFEILEMPTGNIIKAERFREFEKAYSYFKDTKKFEEDLEAQIKKSDKKFILLVEGESDKIILENAWKVLYKDQEMQFAIQNSYSAGCINRELGDKHLFVRNEGLKFIGMFDFDKEGHDKWNGLKKGWQVFEENIFCKKHNEDNGFAFLLPVPDFRKHYANEKLGNDSYMPIEFLFEDQKIEEICCYKSVAGKEGVEIKFLKDKFDKIDFANKTKGFTAEDFKNFKPIFELIERIINEKPSE